MTASPRVFNDLAKVRWLSEVLGETRAVRLISEHFDSVRPSLTSADVADLYDDEYTRGIRSHPTAQMVAGVFPINIYQQPVFDLVCELYPDAKERVLDIGCGAGEFTFALAARGFECVGVDFTESLVHAGRKLAEEHRALFRVPPVLLCGDVNEMQVAGQFDLITLNDVVEHLSDLELLPLLRTCRRLLRPRGKLLIHTPNGRSLLNWTEPTIRGRLFDLYRRQVRRQRPYQKDIRQAYYDQVHINVMGEGKLRKLARAADFSDMRVIYDERHRMNWLSDVVSANMTLLVM